VERWAHGTVVAAPEFPTFYAYNSVRVEDAAEDVGADELAAAADRLQTGFAHRQVEVEDAAAGERLRPGFEALGWEAERLVWMALDGPAHAAPAAAGVEIAEVPFAETRPLRMAWMLDAPDAPRAESDVRAFMLVEENVIARRGSRALVARQPGGGGPIGYAAVGAVADAAEVEQVYVTPGRRGGGIGGALVAAAVAAAGMPRTWIVADDEGAPKRLYARLGFRPAWIQHVFTRRPA
jgi:GNAT superfamily N-acetyltransferase